MTRGLKQNRSISVRVVLVTWILFSSVAFAWAEESDVSDEEIDRLVSELISPNVAPKRKGPFAIYPDGYDKAEQKKVSAAYHKLRELGPKAFPRLFDHFSDAQYSLTGDGGEGDVNKTVGQLCVHLVDSQIEPYNAIGNPGSRFYQRRPSPPNYFRHFELRNRDSAREWWETHKDKSVKELQIEVLEWVISEEDNFPEKYSENDRDDMRKKLETLQAGKDPLPPSGLFAK